MIDEQVAPSLGAVGQARVFRLIAAATRAARAALRMPAPIPPENRWARTGGDDIDPLTGCRPGWNGSHPIPARE
jgi:hypothetical protein